VSSVEHYECRDELDRSKKSACQFVIACCDSSELFEIIEESFDQVSLAIQREIRRSLHDPVCLGWDHRSDLTLPKTVDEGVRIISFVGQKGLWVDLIKH